MQPQEIERYLVALDQAIVDQGVATPVPVLLLGGAYMMLHINARRTTNDIDVFPFIKDELDHATGIPLAVALYQAAHAVATHYQLHLNWLNTIRAGALQPRGVVPQRHSLWKKYHLLEIYLPEPAYVLIQKLLIYRRKDQQDVAALFYALEITTYEQAQTFLDQYISQTEQQQRSLPLLLRSYFRA